MGLYGCLPFRYGLFDDESKRFLGHLVLIVVELNESIYYKVLACCVVCT